MSDPDAPELSTREILLTLVEHEVEYVLVGGVAEVVRGSPRMTMDVDITPRWRMDNLERLAGALRAMAALLRVEGDSERRCLVRFPISGDGLAGFELSTWRTVYGGLDVVRAPRPWTGAWLTTTIWSAAPIGSRRLESRWRWLHSTTS